MSNNKKFRNHQGWSWILIIAFFVLSIFDFRFGILGLLCMAAPLYHALRGRGKLHCSKYCPRGSFLGRFMQYVSLNHTLPKFMRTRKFKHLLLIYMISMFTFSIIYTGIHTEFAFRELSFVVFRFMGVSFIVGILFGIFFKPRSWCQVCPMGHGTALISQLQKNSSKAKKAS
ncbi:hypothetical protein EDC19_1461 [Natranaerovirga hydrolytica]|uniref:4Fe-4S ferredoxin-type domain-containing protein n=1 Tax=Natranaerovirga hydrolytica TaxID=680378 RepID=A0A4R1MME4_9FIRM|nr:4Fe-4S binding protein [Natranaerovirga hydrolytica]TCK93270.1 hypothetical protein EDC19_1461 [Natranaerovirga hydrolytica]